MRHVFCMMAFYEPLLFLAAVCRTGVRDIPSYGAPGGQGTVSTFYSTGTQQDQPVFVRAMAADKAHDYNLSDVSMAGGCKKWRRFSGSSVSDPRSDMNADNHSLDLALAEYKIGEYYEKGLGVPQNYAAAAMWYQKAVENTYADMRPRFALGWLYAHGLGVPRDPAKARAVFATIGGGEGQLLVGMLDAGKLPKSIDGLAAAETEYSAAQKQQEEQANEAQYEAFEHAFAASNAAQRQAPAESDQPSWYTCHSVLSGAPMIAGMAGCSPW